MNGDIDRPGDERTVHVDRHSGEVVAEVGFADYSLLAKSMAVGIAVHQGSMGWWSIALDVLACTGGDLPVHQRHAAVVAAPPGARGLAADAATRRRHCRCAAG